MMRRCFKCFYWVYRWDQCCMKCLADDAEALITRVQAHIDEYKKYMETD